MKPLYIVRLNQDGYYNEDIHWKSVSKKDATKLTHKDALLIRNLMCQPRIGYRASIEPVE